MITCPRCGTDNADTARFCSNCGNALTEATVPAQVAEVRKTVTVLFMDAAGSTSTGENTDPETLRRVMTRYFDEIRTVVERHGGTIEKYIGDAVMAVFGVPTVHEDDALRAVRAADEVRRRLAPLSNHVRKERGFAIDWRTGINTGEVVAGDAGAGQRFVSGDAVNVAARLEQAAQAGEVLIGAKTYALVRGSIVAERADPIPAKGKSDPLVAYRLVDVAVAGAPLSRRLDSPMIGRHRQRRLLQEAFEEVVDARICHLFTILGSAGVGKSRLVGEFLEALRDSAQIFHGRCLSYGEGITFWAIAEAVREAADIEDDDDDDEIRRKLGLLVDDDAVRAQVVELIGGLLGRFTTTSSTEETFWAVRVLLESLGRRRPVVLVLDDIHWADPTLLDLIEHLADWVDDAPLLLVCVARHELVEHRPGWGGGKAHATTITLEPLKDSESRELTVNLLGQVELGGALVEKIAQAAEGNPLFVEEMIGMLIDGGYLARRDDGGWTAARDLTELSVPPSIQALLAARLDRLPQTERAVIECGAVEGKVFHRSAVAELAPAGVRPSVTEVLRALSRKELVRPHRSDFAGDEAFRFRHLLIRDAAYRAMPKSSRAELHALFAEWLERMAGQRVPEYEEIVGYHLEQAYRYRLELGTPDDTTMELGAAAARHFASAAQRALKRGDISAAIKLLGAAAQLMGRDSGERSRVVAELAAALVLANEPRRADEMLAELAAEARAAGDELGEARAEVGRIATQSAIGNLGVQDATAQAERLLDTFQRLGDEWGRGQALLELGRHYFFAGRAHDSYVLMTKLIEHYAPGEAPAREVGFILATVYWGPMPVSEAMKVTNQLTGNDRGPAMESLRLLTIGGLRAVAGELDEGLAMMRRSVAISEEMGRRFLAHAGAGHFLGPLLTLAGYYDEAERVMLRAYSAMADAGDQGFSSTVAGHLAALYVELGRFDEAERWARITLETSTDDDVEAQAQGHGAIARVSASRGDFQAAQTAARRALEIAAATDYLDRHGTALVDLGEVLLEAGRHEEAREAFDAALERFEKKGATTLAVRVRRRLAQVFDRPPAHASYD